MAIAPFDPHSGPEGVIAGGERGLRFVPVEAPEPNPLDAAIKALQAKSPAAAHAHPVQLTALVLAENPDALAPTAETRALYRKFARREAMLRSRATALRWLAAARAAIRDFLHRLAERI